MSRRWIGWGVVVLFLAACSAACAEAPAVAPAGTGCGDIGVATASAMSFDATNKAVVDGLAVSLKLGLLPASFPQDQFAAMTAPCRRGEFKVGKDSWTIYGANTDSPPRWTRSPDGARTLFLALIPDPVEAGAWAAKHRDLKGKATFKTMFYALAETDGHRRLVYAILRHIPDDYHLVLDLTRAISRSEPPIAVIDLDTGDVDLRRLSMAGVQAPEPGAPPEVEGAVDAAFAKEGGDALRHQASGMACPHDVAGYRRTGVKVFNPADGGRDVMCQYYTDNSWFSVFATRFDSSNLDSVFDSYMKDSLAHTPMQHELPAPAGASSAMETKSRFWLGKEGAQQGMWVARRGRWYFQLRVTWQSGSEAQVTAFARQMFDLIARIPSPDGI